MALFFRNSLKIPFELTLPSVQQEPIKHYALPKYNNQRPVRAIGQSSNLVHPRSCETIQLLIVPNDVL